MSLLTHCHVKGRKKEIDRAMCKEDMQQQEYKAKNLLKLILTFFFSTKFSFHLISVR